MNTSRGVFSTPAPLHRVQCSVLVLTWAFFQITSACFGDLAGHWTFDETSGLIARDATGQRDGSLSASGVEFVPGGISGNALALDRALNGYVEIPFPDGMVTGDFSVVIWAKLPVGDLTPETLLLTVHEAWYLNGFFLHLNENGDLGRPEKAAFWAGSDASLGSSLTSINDGQWHQIAMVYDASGMTTFYVDGAPAEVAVPSRPIVDRAPPMLVGGLYGLEVAQVPKGFFTGWVDDLQLYDEALSEVQVDQLFRNPGLTATEVQQSVVIKPDTREFVSSIEVSLRSPLPGAIIRYTLDGADPTAESPICSTSLIVRETTTVKARLFLNGFPVSDVASATFTQVPAVSFQPVGGHFTNEVEVALVNHLSLGAVHYTLDGSNPAPSSTRYSAPFRLAQSATIKAQVFVNSFIVSSP